MAFRVVVLVSGSGTLLQSLIDAQATAGFGARIVAVGSDRSGIEGLERADRAAIPTFSHPLAKGADRAQWDRQLTDLVAGYQPDLVVLAGFMKLVGSAFLERFGGRIINSHPALLPSFPGMHGARDALEYGVRITGSTVFLVDEGVDSGVILDQAAVEVRDDDTADTLHERIKVTERELLVRVVQRLAGHPWRIDGRKVRWDD
ncbi:phosphoribosylglycinamide formyltransferase [Microlunatus sp. Gsoil 973]|uniref:phosphoribosylglycinamide formyltransferase n=1 Tax=Microlunatus sp. Gsoil 973 TaxID=2672569 RepID=UPI0012B4D8AC|nr:phosphoribosylglycinamide formyltransferase [Microlunatus sp. Gsoil 973]QGN35162.1 phosphoribosylglycinamide formyltransferase [Microlunatus sp. Gsoil 973]